MDITKVIICIALVVVIAIPLILLYVHKRRSFDSEISYMKGTLDYLMATRPDGTTEDEYLLLKAQYNLILAGDDNYAAGVFRKNSLSTRTTRYQANFLLHKIDRDNIEQNLKH